MINSVNSVNSENFIKKFNKILKIKYYNLKYLQCYSFVILLLVILCKENIEQ